MFLVNLILIILLLFISFIVYFKIKEYRIKRSIINTKTGESIKGPSIFAFFFELFSKKTILEKTKNTLDNYGDVYLAFRFFEPTLMFDDPKLLKEVFKDPIKKDQKFPGHVRNLLGSDNVIFVNGDR
jgi:hypothetical protein